MKNFNTIGGFINRCAWAFNFLFLPKKAVTRLVKLIEKDLEKQGVVLANTNEVNLISKWGAKNFGSKESYLNTLKFNTGGTH